MMTKWIQIFMIMECLRKGSHFLCFSVILIDSVLKMGKKYYPQVF